MIHWVPMSGLQRLLVKRVLWEVFNTSDEKEQGIARRSCTSDLELRAMRLFREALDGPPSARYADEQDAA